MEILFVIAWLLVLVPSAAALWFFAAFVLHGSRRVRLAVCTFVPAAAVTCLFFIQYWATRIPPAEPGWDIFYTVVCVVSGAMTLIVTFPVFHIVESRFGHYAP